MGKKNKRQKQKAPRGGPHAPTVNHDVERGATAAKAAEVAVDEGDGGVLSWREALVIAFLAGVATMAIEMTASRLLAPAFGTSHAVWTNIIGVMMAALAAGYTIGGRMADRNPSVGVLAGAILVAGLFAAAVPLVARPLLAAEVAAGLEEFPGSFIGTVLLFGPPIFLLGMVNPFAIRLAATRIETSGDLAGRVYSVSTLGSLLGTFLPALFTIPMLGTARTMYLFSVLLVLTGLWCARLAGGEVTGTPGETAA